MDDHALAARVEAANLFCRVTPAQKNRIILALQRRGHVVGYLGDGINDAPSLHSADVGISVDGAVDVAKEAADTHSPGARPRRAARRRAGGRRTFGNIMKYIMMGTSSNFGNMFSMAGGALFLPFLPMLPVQILLNNFLYDLSEIPIPLDSVDPRIARAARAWDMTSIRNFMLVVGPVSSVFDFLTFYVMLARVPRERGAVPHRLVHRVAGDPGAGHLRDPQRGAARSQSRPNRLLAVASLGVVTGAILLPYTPLGGAWDSYLLHRSFS